MLFFINIYSQRKALTTYKLNFNIGCQLCMTWRPELLSNRKTPAYAASSAWQKARITYQQKKLKYVASCVWPEGQDYLPIGKLQHMLPDLHERRARITYQLENCSIWHHLCMHEGQDYLPIGKLQHMLPVLHDRKARITYH